MSKHKAVWQLPRRRPDPHVDVDFGAQPSRRVHYEPTLAQPRTAYLPAERGLISYRDLAKMVNDFEPDD